MGIGCCNVGQFGFFSLLLLISSSLPPLGGERGGGGFRSMVVLGDRSVVWIQIKQINSRRGVLKPKHSLRASRFSERFCFRCEPPHPPTLSPKTPHPAPLHSLRRGFSPLPPVSSSSSSFSWESANVHLRRLLWHFLPPTPSPPPPAKPRI